MLALTCHSFRRYHYKVWQDTKNGRQKTTRDGVESVIEFIGNVSAVSSLSMINTTPFMPLHPNDAPANTPTHTAEHDVPNLPQD